MIAYTYRSWFNLVSVRLVQRRVLSHGSLLDFAKQDMCGQIYAAHGLAMFHSVAWAFVSWIVCAIQLSYLIGVDRTNLQPATGMKLATFEPASPATIPTPEAVYQGFVRSGAAWGFAVPSFIEVCIYLLTVCTWLNKNSLAMGRRRSKGGIPENNDRIGS